MTEIPARHFEIATDLYLTKEAYPYAIYKISKT